uniref:cytochrome c oxidase assembly protein COX18, mitochondrial n=1 Tax=Semicossyphus pulcher TaxID=241346 RepID=UPI0037E993D7
MLTVGGLGRSGVLQLRLLQLPAHGVCYSPFNMKSTPPSHTCSAPPFAGLLTVRCHTLPVRNTASVRKMSGVWKASGVWNTSGVRRSSGGAAADEGAASWYSGLSDSVPVHLFEHFLVSMQQVSGLPWWLSIVVATLSVRTLITLPLAAYQMVIIAKVEALQAEISELAKRLRYEVSVRARERGWTEKQSRFQFQKNLRRIVSQLYIRDNCHPFKASLLVWVQLPLWISLSLALRNLSLDQSALQSGLASGGALWFPDLTSPDSTWILPVCLGLTNLLIVEVFSLQRVDPTRFQKFVTNFIRMFSVLMIPIAATVPSSMALYWFVSSLVGFSHNLVLRSAAVHKLLKLQTRRSESPYRDLLSAFINKYCK